MKTNNVDKSKNTGKKWLSLPLKLVLTLVAFIIVAVVGTLIYLTLYSEYVPEVLALLGGYVLPFALLPLIWLKKKKKYLAVWLMVFAVCAVIIGVNFGMIKYEESITVDTSTYLDLFEEHHDYKPFEEESKIIKLDSELLKLTDNIPAIDGATALFPVYSAFVNAVYPDTTELYDGTFEWYDIPNMPADVEYVPYGYEYLAEEVTDIYLDMYPVKDPQSCSESYGVEFEYTTIGSEAFVFFTHKDNPVDSLSIEQLQEIYSGRITNWSEVGGKNEEIVAYQSDPGSASQEMMELFMGNAPIAEAPTEVVLGNGLERLVTVADYRNKSESIGYSVRYCVREILENPDIKLIAVEGVAPTKDNVDNGSYSLVTPIYAVTREDNTNENVHKLLDWMVSEEAQYIIEESGYFGVVSEYLN